MSKTFYYVIAVMIIYSLVILPSTVKSTSNKKEEKGKAGTTNGTVVNENADKNGVSRGAVGQQKYRTGYTN